jgi:uncharacterized MAPEG superfamily protein
VFVHRARITGECTNSSGSPRESQASPTGSSGRASVKKALARTINTFFIMALELTFNCPGSIASLEATARIERFPTAVRLDKWPQY